MDIYKRNKIRNLILSLLLIFALILQWVGRKNEGLQGLIVQFLSLGLMVYLLWTYNKKFK